MYKFIELRCQNCKHQFMYLENTYKGTRCTLYRRKGHKELLESTICPKCNTEIAILKSKHTGIDITNSSIETAGTIHGI